MFLAGLTLFVLWMTVWINIGKAFGNYLHRKFSKEPYTSGWYAFGIIIGMVFGLGIAVEIIIFLES